MDFALQYVQSAHGLTLEPAFTRPVVPVSSHKICVN
jgi:hypothetical protein